MMTYRTSQSVAIWASYGLHLLLIPAILGLIINYFKNRQYSYIEYEDDSDDTIPVFLLQSHHQWLIRTFNFLLIMFMLAVGTMYYGVGYLIAAAAVIWWFYRMIRGIVSLIIRRPMPGYVQQGTYS